MTKRIWMISDTHLGCRANSVLWLNLIEDYFFNFFIPLAKREHKKGDILYHLGDVFDNRQSLNLAAQDLGIRIFEELTKIFPEVHIIVGNHDIMRKNSNDISSVDCLKYIPKVTVYKEPKVLTYGDTRCLLMPWRTGSEHERETLKKYKDIDYLFCHTEAQGSQTSPSRKHLQQGGNNRKIFKRFNKVYSGHIHYRQELGNVTLVGNPYPMTRSDRDNQKGVYILDLHNGNDVFIPNDLSPKFVRYYINDVYERRMGDLKKEFEGNFVDILIPSNVLGKYNINKFLDYFDGIAKRLEPRIYDEESFNEFDEGTLSDFNGELNLMKISQDYINSLDYDDDLKGQLINSVQELYNETLSDEDTEN